MQIHNLVRILGIPAIAAVTSLMMVSSASAGSHKVTVCHKPGTPAEKTLTVAAAAEAAHLGHGDWKGACPQFDAFIDLDGIATPFPGGSADQEVRVGDVLTFWSPGPIFGSEGIDWFDNDMTCTWTAGDDLHLEDNRGACTTGIRDAFHNLGLDCKVLDVDGSLLDGQPVDVDLEGNIGFTGCPGADPAMGFYDADGSGSYDNGEDIVLDSNANGIFD